MLGKLGRNDACWCGSNKKYKACHMASDEKIETFARQGHIVPPRFILKNGEQIEGIRESGKINTSPRLCGRTYQGRDDHGGD